METTLAATPKARLAVGSAPSSEDLIPHDSGALPFPVPPPNTAGTMPVFALPPASDPHGPTRAQPMHRTRRTTVRVPRAGGQGPLSDALAALASLIENAPLPALPDQVWTAMGRAWFFIAGTTAGILLALALIAIAGPGRAPQREARVGTAQGTARVLVVQRAEAAGDRRMGPLAENDVEDVAVAPPPAAHPAPPVRRGAVVARRAAGASRAASGKDLLSAGL